MRDPDATQFQDVTKCSGDPSVWKGSANGKNAMGAYIGFAPFFYARGTVAFAGDIDFKPLMDRCYSDLPSDPEPSQASDIAPLAPTSNPAGKAAKQSPSVTSAKRHLEADSESPTPEHPNLADGGDECKKSYCPCDKSDPDYGGADIPLCNLLSAGQDVDPASVVAAENLREARRQIRVFKEQNGGNF